MILLKDLFSLLAEGEFANIALKQDRNNSLDESEYSKVIGHINLAIVELYKRFSLLEEELILHASPTNQLYELRAERTAIASRITNRDYIEVEPDHDGYINIIEIKSIYDEDNNLCVLNNRFTTPTIRQMSHDTLKIMGLLVPQKFAVTYQAHPSPIILDDEFNPDACWLDIPKTIIEAILYYVASRVYKPIGANNSTANADKSAGYQQQYELACQKIDLFGLVTDNNDKDPDTFTRQGWA